MSLDSATKIMLAEELEDIAMELVGISQLSPSSKNNDRISQSLQAEIQRLNDITEMYDYKELHSVSMWVHQSVLALAANTKLLLQNNEAGLFYTWLELLAACLRDYDDELLSELKISLEHKDWGKRVEQQDLQSLLSSLTDFQHESSGDSSSESSKLETNISSVPSSSYVLAWADDIHPEILEAFFIESPDQVIELAALIREISSGNADKNTQQSAARIAHTIKGSSAVVGIDAVATFAHKLEDILEYSVDHKLPAKVADLLIESADCLENMFDSLLTQSPAPQQYPQLLEQLSLCHKKFSTGFIADKKQQEQAQTPSKKSSYALAWNKDVHPELLDAYMGETPAHVIEISALLRTISKEKASPAIYKKAAHLSHTIKGTSAVVGITAVADLAHQLEEVLDYASETSLPPKLLPLFSESADLLESIYDSLLSEGTPPQEYHALYQKLCDWNQILKNIKGEQEQTPQNAPDADKEEKSNGPLPKINFDFPPLQEILTTPAVQTVTTPAAEQRKDLNETSLRIPISIIEKLLNFSSELITSNTQLAEQVNSLLAERQSSNERNDSIRKIMDELEWAVDQQTSIRSKSLNKQKKTDFDSLELDSYNELHSITGLLSEAINDDREVSITLMQQLNELKGHLHKQKQINRELNNTVLNMRMEPIKILSPRLERIVRETCRRTNKQAELEIIGDELAIDTDVIKGLVDPLLHLLRNAVDHGIESTEERKKKSKDKMGKIQLRFSQQGDQVILVLKDDGAGIDTKKVYQLAIKKGLINKDSKLSKSERLRLILHPGFSTQESVSEISGRGVGMDVVNSAIKNLSGNISIESTKNKGCEIRLQVPLTLSAANILLVKVLENTVAIPNASIQQVHYLTQDNIVSKANKLFINFQDQLIPLLALSTLLAWAPSAFYSNKNQAVIIVEYRQKYFALYVDEILKPQEITLKPLKPWMPDVTGVNGVCLLADGVVAPVLNIFDLLRLSVKSNITPINSHKSTTKNIAQNRILVVDDSLSNRKALSLMLQALGYEVSTAIDGFDALKKIEKSIFQLVITDLEMPKMDGLELVESLRSLAATCHIPIIMVTSRSTQKHQNLAKQAGVNVYLTKPVDSATLKSTVIHFLPENDADKFDLKMS